MLKAHAELGHCLLLWSFIFGLFISPTKKKVLSSLFNETVIFKTQKAGFVFEGSKGSLAKMFWKILLLAFLIGEYDQAVL